MGKLENDLIEAETTRLISKIAACSRHKNVLVRLTVLDNPKITEDIVREMLNDRNSEVRFKAELKISEYENRNLVNSNESDSAYIHCSECKEPTLSGDNFCRNCGAEVSITGPYCKSCEVEREEDSLFCRICGDKLLLIKTK